MAFSFGAKDRLYIGLYRRKQPGTYHWSLLCMAKDEGSASLGRVPNSTPVGRCFHVKNILVPAESGVKEEWAYEVLDVDGVKHRPDMVARILVAKVKDRKRLEQVLERVPVVQDDAAFRCNTWLATALAALHTDGKALSSSALADPAAVQSACSEYVDGKVSGGRYKAGSDTAKVPTWSMLESKELQE